MSNGEYKGTQVQWGLYSSKDNIRNNAKVPRERKNEGEKVIARQRGGHEERNNNFCLSESRRIYRMCGEVQETLEYMLQDQGEIKEKRKV